MSNLTKSLYLGKASERYVMSALLARGWNIAMPDVDIGDDIFVVGDNLGIFQKILSSIFRFKKLLLLV